MLMVISWMLPMQLCVLIREKLGHADRSEKLRFIKNDAPELSTSVKRFDEADSNCLQVHK